MTEPAPLPTGSGSPPAIPADVAFAALSDPTRVQLLRVLFDGQFHTAPAVGGSLPKHRDLVRKHLAVLVKAGLVVAERDPADNRRQIYRLARKRQSTSRYRNGAGWVLSPRLVHLVHLLDYEKPTHPLLSRRQFAFGAAGMCGQ